MNEGKQLNEISKQSTRSILIIDDETYFYQNVTRVLRNHDFRPITICSSFEQGASRISKNDYDILLISLSLSDGKGFEFVSNLRIAGNTSAIVFVSDTVSIETMKRAIFSGGNDLFLKSGRSSLDIELLSLLSPELDIQPTGLPSRTLSFSLFLRSAQLNDFEKRLLDMYFIEFPSQKELAARLGRSHAYIRKNFSRIHEKLMVENQAQLAGMLTLCSMFGHSELYPVVP